MKSKTVLIVTILMLTFSCSEKSETSNGGSGTATARVENDSNAELTVTLNGESRGTVPPNSSKDFVIPTGTFEYLLQEPLGASHGTQTGIIAGQVVVLEYRRI